MTQRNLLLTLTLKNAEKVIVPSAFVKNDIIKHFGSKFENKVEVIHNPIDHSRFEGKVSEGKEMKFPYIFSVANLNCLQLKYFYKFDGDVLRYEIADFITAVNTGKKSYKLSNKESLTIVELLDTFKNRLYTKENIEISEY